MKTVKIIAIVAIFAAFTTKAFSQDYKTIDGLKYKIYNPHKGAKPAMGDKVTVDLIVYDDRDSMFYNSFETHKLIPIPIQKSQFKGDLLQGIELLSIGDSAVFLISTDSIAKLAGKNNTLRLGATMKYVVVLRSISTKEDQQAEMIKNAQKAQQQDQLDEKIITDYITANKIEGMKRTSTGLYYKITQQGTGPIAVGGQAITAHYTGKFLDGKVFDSDKDRPGPGFQFTLGMHGVIEGWDEAFALMNKGSKATIIIPSKLAYGANGIGPIPANAVLMFDV